MSDARTLSRFERALAMTGAFAPFNIVTWVELDRHIAFADLQSVVEELWTQHSGLQLSLNDAQRAFVQAQRQPACEQLSGQADDLIEAALHHRFSSGEALWRIDLPTDATQPALLLTFHHVLIDGEAKLILIHDLLARLGAGIAVPRRILGRFNQTSAPRQIVRALQQGMIQEWQYQRGATHARSALPTASSQVMDLALTEAVTNHLLQAVRRRRTTLNSLLQAALCQAYARGIGDSPVLLRGMCFANQRPKLRPKPPATQLGAGITLIPYLADPLQDLWTLSHDIQAQNRATLAEGGHFAMNWLSPWIIGMGLRSQQRMGDVALSFSGAIPTTGTFGGIQLTGLRSYISSHRKGPPFSGWGYIAPEGALQFCFSYHSLAEGVAVEVCQAFQEILEEAAKNR